MANTPALTTTFTPSPSCLSNLFVERYTGGNAPDGVNAYVLGDVRATASCLPDELDPSRTSYFSPGLYCPSGYSSACGTTISIPGAQETHVNCCPRGGYDCKSADATFWPFDTLFGCARRVQTTQVTRVTNSSAGQYVTRDVTLRGGYDFINAHSVQYRFQATDLVSETGGAGQSSAAATSESSASSSSTASGAPADGDSGGLSTGAKLGIGLGVGIPVAALFGGLLVWLLLWRRKKARNAGGGMDPMPYGGHQQQGPPHMQQYGQYDAPKYGPVAPTELDGHGPPSELPGSTR